MTKTPLRLVWSPFFSRIAASAGRPANRDFSRKTRPDSAAVLSELPPPARSMAPCRWSVIGRSSVGRGSIISAVTESQMPRGASTLTSASPELQNDPTLREDEIETIREMVFARAVWCNVAECRKPREFDGLRLAGTRQARSPLSPRRRTGAGRILRLVGHLLLRLASILNLTEIATSSDRGSPARPPSSTIWLNLRG